MQKNVDNLDNNRWTPFTSPSTLRWQVVACLSKEPTIGTILPGFSEQSWRSRASAVVCALSDSEALFGTSLFYLVSF
jgi:hypothetical protein